mmetsp:Transcript_42159/g.76414  ORF Transcript_42159/g.76414 Transcript_42159/m.76414 type:complete len:141 (+) Transcript_42159:78-500(+)
MTSLPGNNAAYNKLSEPMLQRVLFTIIDVVWQYAHVGVASFLFYEDRILFACTATGYLGLVCGIVALSASGTSPMQGERLWRISIPACGILSVVVSLGSRVIGWTSAQAVTTICFLLLVTSLVITVGSVKGEKEMHLGLE